MPYRTYTAEPGMLVEIYLPKRAKYQGPLYTALTDGLEVKKVTAYLHEHAGRVEHLVRPNFQQRFADRAKHYEQVFHGFSMYEVDGVFKGEEVYEERTQVLRLLFKPNYDMTLEGVDEKDKPRIYEYMRRFRKIPISITDDPIEHFKTFERIKELQDLELRALQTILNWTEDIHLFVFGYLIGYLTELEGLKEEEIWVTSYRSAVVNVIKKPADGPPPVEATPTTR